MPEGLLHFQSAAPPHIEESELFSLSDSSKLVCQNEALRREMHKGKRTSYRVNNVQRGSGTVHPRTTKGNKKFEFPQTPSSVNNGRDLYGS